LLFDRSGSLCNPAKARSFWRWVLAVSECRVTAAPSSFILALNYRLAPLVALAAKAGLDNITFGVQQPMLRKREKQMYVLQSL